MKFIRTHDNKSSLGLQHQNRIKSSKNQNVLSYEHQNRTKSSKNQNVLGYEHQNRTKSSKYHWGFNIKTETTMNIKQEQAKKSEKPKFVL